MSAFLSRVNVVVSDEHPPMLTITVTDDDNPFAPEGVDLYATEPLPESFDKHWHDAILTTLAQAVHTVETANHLTVSDPVLSDEEMKMLKTQYDKGTK